MPHPYAETNPDILRRALTTTTLPNCRVVEAKLFHHNNLVLQLLYDTAFSIYTLNVHRINDQSDTQLWGLYLNDADGRESAYAKFNEVRL